jgi:hypothetical protein
MKNIIKLFAFSLFMVLFACETDLYETPDPVAVTPSTPNPTTQPNTGNTNAGANTNTQNPEGQQTSTNTNPFLHTNGAVRGKALIDSLRKGGYIIYFRHALATTGSDAHTDINDCSVQRNLTFPEARTQAEAVGNAFRALRIPIATNVLTSEYCRCKQTSDLAFGTDATTPTRELSGFNFRYDYRIPQDEIARRLRVMNQRFETPTQTGRNQVMVAHANNFDRERPADNPIMGAVILRPLGEGRGYQVAVRVDDYTRWTQWVTDGY